MGPYGSSTQDQTRSQDPLLRRQDRLIISLWDHDHENTPSQAPPNATHIPAKAPLRYRAKTPPSNLLRRLDPCNKQQQRAPRNAHIASPRASPRNRAHTETRGSTSTAHIPRSPDTVRGASGAMDRVLDVEDSLETTCRANAGERTEYIER